ncbi:hypothetical protein ACFPT7_05460 [Acidicapsa dinghuensis]|uniref:Uncharacterized protein n=1 Tax=Acidicapsa dinghuensis TaxID=2218256 RepID=A0ABW1EBL6_9BACT|nr:hypothetical protein [Acidicapsa dinghuensis]
MPAKAMTAEELIALFKTKTATSPPESSQMLVRHTQCKESLALSRSIVEAMDRYAGNDNQLLAAPTELLPPLA